MEEKEVNMIKLPYVTPEIIVLNFSIQDVITASGYDSLDNWMDDNFIIE